MMVEIIILISSILFGTVSLYRARSDIKKAIRQRMLDIANCASGSVNGDVLGSLEEEDVGNATYEDLYNRLAVFRDNVGELEYVYSIKESSPGHFVFTMDLDPVTPASYGDDVEYTEALASAGRGIAAVDEVPYEDQWGRFYSAYSPVFDSGHKVAGIIAVDFSAEWFEGQLSEQTRSTVIGYAVILLLSLLVAALLSLLIVRPFVRAQGELLEEKVRAESANQAKSDFLANMSHEIRTPINAVLGMNEMIIREDNKAKEDLEAEDGVLKESLDNIALYAGDVKSAGNNLLAIVNDILDFSKIEAGRMDIVEAPYQLSSIINDLNNMILFKAQDKDLAFTVDIDQSIPDALSGDEVRIRQILTNILNNAVKYTEQGSVRLTLKGEDRKEGNIVLSFSVKDTGIGIRPEDKEKLFTKFQRLEMEHNSTVEGTGLGLVISKRLLDMMGGSISLESEYGKGSEFRVRIPQKIINDTPMGDYQARFEANLKESRPYRESFRAPSARILIVDDTRINLTVVVNLLKNTRIRVDTATSGSDAVEMAKDTPYDLILMDQRMPNMNGTEALHKILDTVDGANVKTPMICLTADAVIGAKERYIAEGFTDYLSKPIDSTSLEKMLIKYLPDEKIERVRTVSNAAVPEEDSKEEEWKDSLRKAGIEPQTGLLYCQNDEDFYRSILAEFAKGSGEKILQLNGTYEEEDWHDYGIYVHSLKSSSKMIGAWELSDLAAKLETAALNEDQVTIKKEHDLMMKMYQDAVSGILTLMPDVSEEEKEEEILEFMPEGE